MPVPAVFRTGSRRTAANVRGAGTGARRLRARGQVALGLIALIAPFAGFASPDLSCHAGVYRDSRGTNLILSHTSDGHLRYLFLDGRTGLLRSSRPGVLTAGPGWSGSGPVVARLEIGPCGQQTISFSLEGVETAWTRVPLRRQETQFRSLGETLTADLITPAGAREWPLVVLVHGSEKTSARRYGAYPYVLASAGIGVFVYDKRGTGSSAGAYTQNFYVLAQDAAAAVEEARRIAGGRATSIGLFGGSQGGWIAPRAATQADVDFVVVAFGLLGSPLEEDAWEISYELQRRGFGAAEIAHARELTDATARVIASGFTTGYAQVQALKRRYAAEPWFALVEGEYSGEILRRTEQDLRRSGRADLDDLGIHWEYDAVDVVRRVPARQVWILACEDSEAPGRTTVSRLMDLRAAGKDIDILLFPDTDHGITEFVEAEDGTRTRTRYAPGYFEAVIDAVQGRPGNRYGRASRVPSGKSPQHAFRSACGEA